MHFFYETKELNLEITKKTSVHVPPHLHHSLECIYVTKGSLELGVGEELYHMDTHDFGIVFPNMIHHYQVFDHAECEAIYLLSAPSLWGAFSEDLQNLVPESPVISDTDVHSDVIRSLESLLTLRTEPYSGVLHQAYTQIILARSFSKLHLLSGTDLAKHDIIYDTVSYMAGHFMEDISLTQMAKDLGLSQYALSRVFSSTFHMNFNQYLNDLRLNHAVDLLENTSESITDLALNSGFTSLRTFNRAFKERFRVSPRDYRKKRNSPVNANSKQ